MSKVAGAVRPAQSDAGWSCSAPGRTSDRAPDIGHAEANDDRADGGFLHGLELLAGGSERSLDRGHLAEPALLFGLGEAVDEMGVDLLQPGC
jgi:hypothetical protein